MAKRTPRFLTRVFTAEEIAYCRGKKQLWQHFAVRFAAKVAVWKAFDRKARLKDISVSRDADGKPGVLFKGKPLAGFKLSLSHSERYALAVAIKTQEAPSPAASCARRWSSAGLRITRALFGHVLIVAGSRGMAGAALLSAARGIALGRGLGHARAAGGPPGRASLRRSPRP